MAEAGGAGVVGDDGGDDVVAVVAGAGESVEDVGDLVAVADEDGALGPVALAAAGEQPASPLPAAHEHRERADGQRDEQLQPQLRPPHQQRGRREHGEREAGGVDDAPVLRRARAQDRRVARVHRREGDEPDGEHDPRRDGQLLERHRGERGGALRGAAERDGARGGGDDGGVGGGEPDARPALALQPTGERGRRARRPGAGQGEGRGRGAGCDRSHAGSGSEGAAEEGPPGERLGHAILRVGGFRSTLC